MRKIGKPSYIGSAALTYSKLYRDDIEQIAEIMKEESLDVSFTKGNYEYDSLNELVEKNGTSISQMNIIGKKVNDHLPWRKIVFNVDGREFWLRADDEFELIWHRIKNFVASKTPWYSRYTNPWIWSWIFFFVAEVDTSLIDHKVNNLAWFHSLIFLVFLIFMFSLLRTITCRGVVLVSKHADKNFWSRNQDRIVSGVIGAIIIMLIQYLAKTLLGIK